LLAAGYDADVIVLDADPLADLSVPTHVRGVRWDGRRPRAE
jgi:imidazolonepropionase-like amidohydrolase